MNNKRLLQLLILGQWLLLIAAAVAGAFEQRHLPQVLTSYNRGKAAELTRKGMLWNILMLIYAVAYLSSSISLLRNKFWAKVVYPCSILIGFIIRVFFGTQVVTPVAGIIGSIAMFFMGGTIIVLYVAKNAVIVRAPFANSENENVPSLLASASSSQAETGAPAAPIDDNHAEDWRTGIKGLVRNLKSGLRAAAFLKVKQADFRTSTGQILALAVSTLLVTVFFNLVRAGVNSDFNFDYLPSTIFYLPLMIVFAYLTAGLESRQELENILPIALMSSAFWVEFAGSIADLLIKADWFYGSSFGLGTDHYYHLYAWWFLSSLVLIHRFGPTLRRPFLVRSIFLIVLAVPFWFIPKWDLWIQPYVESDSPRKSVAEEKIFYSQPALLEKTLAAIRPGRKGLVDLYFVGFGADASQDVFMHEIRAITQLFNERFDTKGRSVALINNAKTIDSVPIATRTALRRTIDQFGRRMNRDEDILFLYLTSHGSESYKLSVDFWPLRLNEIFPQDIKRMLDEAGIRWRVVVVSECYSGGYIDALKNDDTVVITSSDGEHTSFGCSNDSDFTYFGKAYFDEVLRKSYSFVKSFPQAKDSIQHREQEQTEKSSNPQIYVGASIRRQLDLLEDRLKISVARLGGKIQETP